jgi:hypothetical protein
MKSTLKFIAAAYASGVAYIDVDGTILRRYSWFGKKDMSLDDWMRELMPTRVIRRRLPMLYLLKWMGVRLVLWTNRPPELRWPTMLSLGKHIHLFSRTEFHNGKKYHTIDQLNGPVMDDGDLYDYNCPVGSLQVKPL